jgi:hypothetical protein
MMMVVGDDDTCHIYKAIQKRRVSWEQSRRSLLSHSVWKEESIYV